MGIKYDVVDNSLEINTSRRLPIVLCLDISPSMSLNHRIETLNETVKKFVKDLAESKDVKMLNSVEIAVVTFSTEIEVTDFHSLKYWKEYLKNNSFSTVEKGGSNISGAVLKSIKLIEDRTAELEATEIDSYLPYLVLVTDGDPDATENKENVEKAIKAVLRHCETSSSAECRHLIAPYIIGVGEQVVEESLNRFAEKFTGEAIIINEDVAEQNYIFKELFDFIANSVTNSLKGADDLKGLYEVIQKSTKKLINDEKSVINKKKKKGRKGML